MESKKINQLATELTPVLSDLTIIGDPTTGISKKITLSQMASLFTGTVEEYPNLASFPLVGTADTIYIALDTNVLYRWNTGTNAYVELSPNIINSLVFNDANGFDGTINLVGSVATLTITTALTQGSVPFIGTSGALTQDNANLFFDDTNNRLGINTNSPTTALDVFGSGIIGRVNGTSTNNAFLGFASAGTNRWSIGNVQSDHRFRIYNEATTSELVSVLSTGEFGIGIVNPTTKVHIDGGASALIANLDANVSVAKSVSFRSDNSNRINLEVSGTESGSNAGANFFLRTYTDLGALIETPFSIVRSTGVTTIKSLTLTNALSVANGGTGSTTQNFVDLTTTQSVGGAKTFTSQLTGTSVLLQSNSTTTQTLKIVPVTSQTASILNIVNSSDTINLLTVTAAGNVIMNGGNIGIGTTSPSYLLHTKGSGAFNGAIFSDNSSTTGSGAFNVGQNGVSKGALCLSANLLGDTSSDLALFGDTSNGIRFYTNGVNERMRITSGGNVGIGTSAPSDKLTIVGGNILVDQSSFGTAQLRVKGTGTTTGFDIQNSNNDGYLWNRDSGNIYFATGNTERMRITSGGNVCIGLTASNLRLGVRGADTGSTNFTLYADNGSNPLFTVRNDGYIVTGTEANSPCNSTTTNVANLHVFTSNGALARSVASSKRFKENITDWEESGIHTILSLKPKTFTYKKEYYSNSDIVMLGLIAEEVAEVSPYLADYENEDRTGQVENVRYATIVVPLIKAVQELKSEIDELKSLINK